MEAQSKAGEYYYTISKNGAALNLASPVVNLTTFDEIVNVPGVNGLLVNKGANGVGNYTIVIYKGVGNTAGATASALSPTFTSKS